MKPSIDIDPEFLDNCDVRYVQDHYMRTGELTNEMNHKVVKDLSKP